MALRLLLATGNPHKLREAREILAGCPLEVVGPDAVGGLPEVVEDGETFAANARKKAASACRHSGLWTLADDSGIEARALAWAPGVRSARYAGFHGDDAANCAKLLAELDGVADRYVRFRCVIALARIPHGIPAARMPRTAITALRSVGRSSHSAAMLRSASVAKCRADSTLRPFATKSHEGSGLARPDAETLMWEGTFPGECLTAPRGRGGFGYDPVVEVPELGRSVAELDPAEKHRLSHRGQALRACRDWLLAELASP